LLDLHYLDVSFANCFSLSLSPFCFFFGVFFLKDGKEMRKEQRLKKLLISRSESESANPQALSIERYRHRDCPRRERHSLIAVDTSIIINISNFVNNITRGKYLFSIV
jgi:hypothetical protein